MKFKEAQRGHPDKRNAPFRVGDTVRWAGLTIEITGTAGAGWWQLGGRYSASPKDMTLVAKVEEVAR